METESVTDSQQGLEKAKELLRQAVTPHGYVAAVTEKDNYRRIWARDGAIISVVALQTEEEELIQAAEDTLKTLAKYQGPHGEIPSNVDAEKDKVSYGGTAGRVDANLWFIIAVHRYWQYTEDDSFLTKLIPALQQIEFLLGAWEFNTKGLIYVPETGDWADEYIQHGYVLYDQVLYHRSLLVLGEMYEAAGLAEANKLREKAAHLRELIQANYWFYDCDPTKANAYHPTLFRRGCEMAEERGAYWMSYFSPTAYGYRFDAMANVLISLFGIAEPEQQQKTDDYIRYRVMNKGLKVLPAFSPVIEPIDGDWQKLQSNFSNNFKNKPHQFHNGGLWPLLNGFYVADLAVREKTDLAEIYLEGIHRANLKDKEGEQWGFYEYIHGQTFEPGGTRHQTWSAAAAIMGYHALQGSPPFP